MYSWEGVVEMPGGEKLADKTVVGDSTQFFSEGENYITSVDEFESSEAWADKSKQSYLAHIRYLWSPYYTREEFDRLIKSPAV